MRYKQCNRCDAKYRPIHGGSISMKGGTLVVSADLCSDCYEHMIEAYNDDKD